MFNEHIDTFDIGLHFPDMMVEYSYCLFHYRLVDVELRGKALSTALVQ